MAIDATHQDQILNFFFFTAYQNAVQTVIKAKIEIVNPYTGANYTTPWEISSHQPFDPSALDHTYADGTDYYAYYKNHAFKNPFSDHEDFGYVIQLS